MGRGGRGERDMHGGEGRFKSNPAVALPTPEMPTVGHACTKIVIGGCMAYFTLPFSKTRAPLPQRPLPLPLSIPPSFLRINWVRSRPNCGKSSGELVACIVIWRSTKRARPTKQKGSDEEHAPRMTHKFSLPHQNGKNTVG